VLSTRTLINTGESILLVIVTAMEVENECNQFDNEEQITIVKGLIMDRL
jgi:hypothetical protein